MKFQDDRKYNYLASPMRAIFPCVGLGISQPGEGRPIYSNDRAFAQGPLNIKELRLMYDLDEGREGLGKEVFHNLVAENESTYV